MIFDYEAQQDDELNLKVGDVIKDVQNVSSSFLFAPSLVVSIAAGG